MADRGRSTTPPPPRSTTRDGLPAPAPRPSRPPIAEGRRRLTLNFSGPPLAVEGAAEDGEDGMLAPPSSPGIELELDLAPSAGGAAVEGHDAWIASRRARATPAPRASSPGLASLLPRSAAPHGNRRATPSGSLPAVVDESDAYRLIERARPSLSLDLASEVAERYGLGDFSGALRAAELWLGADPDNAEAAEYAASCRVHLEQFYQSKLGSFERVAHVAVAQSEIRWLGLDHRAGFFLSRVDGTTTVDELLDLSGMPRLEALKTLVELLDMGAVRLS